MAGKPAILWTVTPKMEAVFTWITQYGYGALFVLLMLGIVGLPIPDETLLTFCGYLIWTGRMETWLTFLAGFGGSVCGISLSYLLGRTAGHRLVERYGRILHITPERLLRVHRWFDHLGTWLLSVGYFIPGVRHFTALVAGMTELRFGTFALFAYTGAAVWVGTFLLLGYMVGDRWRHTSEVAHKYLLLGTLVLAAAVLVFLLVRRRGSSTT